SGNDIASEDGILSAPGTAAATFTFTTAARYQALMAAFKAAGTPAYVQGAIATTNAGSASLTRAFTAPVTAGHLIVVAVAWAHNVPLTVTDTQGNTYAAATTVYDAVNDQSLAIVYAANVAGGATTITAAFGAAAPIQRLAIHEYAGVTTANPLDAIASNVASGNTSANNVTSTAAATTVTAPAMPGPHTLTAVAR